MKSNLGIMTRQRILAVTIILFSLSVTANVILFKRQLLPKCNMEMFDLRNEIGKGVSARVYNIERKNDNQVFAIKKGNRNLSNEIEALSRIKGLGIAPDILCASEDRRDFIMKKVNGVTLNDANISFLYNLDPNSSPTSVEKSKRLKLLQTVAIQMLSIMEEVHKVNIYHGDAHWKNWMVEKESLKIFLIDFGNCNCNSMNTQNEVTRKKNDNLDVARTMRSLYSWAVRNLLLQDIDLPPILTQFKSSVPSDYVSKMELTSIAEILKTFKAMKVDK